MFKPSTVKNGSLPVNCAMASAACAIGNTGIYYDDGGHPMLGSKQARDPGFTDRIVAETRALLSTIPT
jgi:hypothetical protein